MNTPLPLGTWAEAFFELGFAARTGDFVREGLRASVEQGWLVLRASAGGTSADDLAIDADWPGLWRRRDALARVFELPPSLVRRVEGELALPSARSALAWGVETLENGGWEERVAGVALAEVASVATPGGGHVARVVATERGFELALAQRSLSGVGAGRAAWARAILRDARARWRLVRLLLVEERPVARVDLRGAPEELREELAAAALDALRWVGGRLIEPLDVVLDPQLVLPALEAGADEADRVPRRARPASTRRAAPALPRKVPHGADDFAS
jgi:hypothetical protein